MLYIYAMGPSIKDVRREGGGRGSSKADKCGQGGRGVVDKVDVRNNKKLFSII